MYGVTLKGGGTAERDVGGGSTSHLKLHLCIITRSDGALYQFRTTWPHHSSVSLTLQQRERDQMETGEVD